jgi:hypothetical protein
MTTKAMRTKTMRLALAVVFGVLPLCVSPAMAGEADALTPFVQSPAAEDEWEFDFQINAWLPRVEVTSAGGTELDFGLDDLVNNLRGVVEVGVGVRKGKWSLSSDIIYGDLKFKDLDRMILDQVNLKEWLVTPKISYRAFEGDWGYVDLQAGMRYTWVDLVIKGAGPEGRGFDEDVSGDIYDGLVGFTGEYNLSDRWFLPFMIEAGAGDSDSVFAAYGGVGYRYKYADVLFVFKYLSYDFSDSAPVQDEEIFGPKLSVRFTF